MSKIKRTTAIQPWTEPDGCHRFVTFPGRTLFVLFALVCTFGDYVAGQITCPSGQTTASNPCVFTSQYDNKRSGFNSFETQLNATTVSSMSGTAKTLFEVDDNYTYTAQLPSGQRSNPIYAQPLYVPGIIIGTHTYNMLVVVTLNDTIFAWDTAGSPPTSNLLWSRQGIPPTDPGGNAQNPQGSAGNALWRDDCGQSGSPTMPAGTSSLPYFGILSTPVIDGSRSTPVMLVTSHCTNSTPQKLVYIHEIDLTTGKDVVVGTTKQARNIGTDMGSAFDAGKHKQRAALLGIQNSNNSNTPNLTYVPFGTGTVENDALSHPYHGWLTAYTVSSSYALTIASVSGSNFAFSTTPTACGSGTSGGIQGGQCTNNGGSPACDCYLYTAGPTFQNVPNWGGQGGGCWMSGRGMAATNVGDIQSDGAVHTFLGCGNGGFQDSGVSPANFGESVMDFRLYSTGFDYTAPHQSFTPNGSSASVVLRPPLPSTNICHCTPGTPPTGCGACSYTFQTLNANDWDQSVSGILLFDDLAGDHRLVTVDKAGYGYLMTQGSLGGFTSNDQGNWPFGASITLCDQLANPQASNCDRVTSMAFYNTLPGSSTAPAFFYFWPDSERLTAYQLSDNSTQNGTLRITWQSGTPTIITTNSACTPGTNCLTSYLVPGDTIVATGTGCACSGSTCPVVTGVSDSTATSGTICGSAGGPCAIINRAFPTGCTPPQFYTYNGYS